MPGEGDQTSALHSLSCRLYLFLRLTGCYSGRRLNRARKRYICKQPGCDRGYDKAEHLIRHERSHLGLKPFACAVCHRRFGRQDSMLRHSKLHQSSGSLETAKAHETISLDLSGPTRTGQGLPHEVESSLPQVLSIRQDILPPFSLDPQSAIDVNQDPSGQNETQPGHAQYGVHQSNTVSTVQEMGRDQIQDFEETDFGFDWTVAPEDIFGLFRSEAAMVNLALPITHYAQYGTDAQTCLSDGSMDRHAQVDIVNAGRDAVQDLSNIIKDLPAKLVAELDKNDAKTSFFDDCMDLFFTRFLTTFPLVHKPTFHARECIPSLLLNMLALGSSFIGSKAARTRVSTCYLRSTFQNARSSSWRERLPWSLPVLIYTAFRANLYGHWLTRWWPRPGLLSCRIEVLTMTAMAFSLFKLQHLGKYTLSCLVITRSV